MVYLPELLERVSAGEVVKAKVVGINFTVFSLVMAYNNKNVGDTFLCHVTLVSKTSTIDFPNSEIF